MNSMNPDRGVEASLAVQALPGTEKAAVFRSSASALNPALLSLAERGTSALASIRGRGEASILASDDLNHVFRTWAASRILLGKQVTRSEILCKLGEDVAAIDKALNVQVDTILHHTALQKLEGSWRGLFYLVNQAEGANSDSGTGVGGKPRVKVRVLSVKKRELRRDQETAVEFDRSDLWQKVYENEFGTAGGIPYGLLVCDHQFSHHPDDVSLLSGMSETAMAAFAPLLVSPEPAIFGSEQFNDLEKLPRITDTQASKQFVKWKALREREESRFIGLPLPRVLGRHGYNGLIGHPNALAADERSWEQRGFRYKEKTEAVNGSGNLWMSGVWPFASTVIREFGRSGWFANLRGGSRGVGGGGEVAGLPKDTFSGFENSNVRRGPTEVNIPSDLGEEFERAGMIPLEATGSDGRAVFHSNMSLHKPKLFDNQKISENERLSSMMQYVLCVSRFAQYLKVILRDKLGSFTEAPQAEKFLSDWVHQYVSPDDQASDETRAKMPLRAAEIEVQDDPGSGGTMKVVMRLQPHFQIDRIDSTLRLISAVHYDPNKMSSRRG